ncbi:hypothetical protein H0H93_000737 [Arthromyces matolae]|nr:hypothetical protein H0H93_000737 [Arthromyces matolae]
MPEDISRNASQISSSTSCAPNVLSATEYIVLDLYETRDKDERAKGGVVPFYHELELKHNDGSLWTWGHFDDGAMVDAISVTLWEKLRASTSPLEPTSRRLRMANGSIVTPLGCWRGIIRLAGIEALVSLEVFDSGGGWEFLFGKNLMRVFGVVHDYLVDEVTVNVSGRVATLTNGYHAMHSMSPDQRAETSRGCSAAPAREVQSHTQTFENPSTDKDPTPDEGPVHTGTDAVCEVAEDLEQDIDPFKPERVNEVLRLVQVGADLSEDERRRVYDLIAEYADAFALAVSEVKHVKGASHVLHIDPDATFSTKVHQKPLTPPQKEYLHKSIDDMLAAGIIERCNPAEVKCVSPTTLAQKAHAGEGLSLEELQHRVNDECI